jgi:hypothetical protein
MQMSSFEITIKSDTRIDFDALKRKVEDPGFSVSQFVATIKSNRVWVKNNETLPIGSAPLSFMHIRDQQLEEDKQVQFLDKGFVEALSRKYLCGWNTIFLTCEGPCRLPC